MAQKNPFDQFDATQGGNPFDQFDSATEQKPRGTIDVIKDLGVSLWEGGKTTGRSAAATASTYANDLSGVEDLAASNKAAQADSPEAKKALLEEIERRKQADKDKSVWSATKNVAGAMAGNVEGSAQFIAEQAPNSAVSLGAGWVGAKTGTAAGLAVAPFLGPLAPAAPVVGGVGGFLTGMFLGNTLLETGGKAMEKAEGGFTPAERSDAISEGAVKGGVITAIDGATLGVGGKIAKTMNRAAIEAGARAEAQVLADAGVNIADRVAVEAALAASPALRETAMGAGKVAAKSATTASARAAQAGTGLTLETVGEGFGEHMGELAATGKADIYDSVLEAAAGFSQSAPETAWNMRRSEGNNLDAKGIQQSGVTPGASSAASAADVLGSAEQTTANTDVLARIAELETVSEQRQLTPHETAELFSLRNGGGESAEQKTKALPAPTITVDSDGNAVSDPAQLDTMRQIESERAQAVTGDMADADVRAQHPGAANEGMADPSIPQNNQVLSLPAPSIAVDSSGRTSFDQSKLSSLNEQERAAQSAVLGDMPDQSVRFRHPASSMDWLSFVRSKGFNPVTLKKSMPEWNQLRAEFDAVQRGVTQPEQTESVSSDPASASPDTKGVIQPPAQPGEPAAGINKQPSSQQGMDGATQGAPTSEPDRRDPRSIPTAAGGAWREARIAHHSRVNAASPTFQTLPLDIRRKIANEAIDAELAESPVPLDVTSGLINGKAVTDASKVEDGSIGGTMLEGMLNSAIEHVKQGGVAHVSEIDLGNLGGINHFSGQTGGDKAIQAIGGAIKKAFDDAGLSDKVEIARFGGDEFFIVGRADAATLEKAAEAANAAVDSFVKSTTPRMLNPGNEAAVLANEKLDDTDKRTLLQFQDTPLYELSKKPIKLSRSAMSSAMGIDPGQNPDEKIMIFPEGVTKIHVGDMVPVRADSAAHKLHNDADMFLAAAKTLNSKGGKQNDKNAHMGRLREDAEQGSKSPAGRSAWAGNSTQDSDSGAGVIEGGTASGTALDAGVAGRVGESSSELNPKGGKGNGRNDDMGGLPADAKGGPQKPSGGQGGADSRAPDSDQGGGRGNEVIGDSGPSLDRALEERTRAELGNLSEREADRVRSIDGRIDELEADLPHRTAPVQASILREIDGLTKERQEIIRQASNSPAPAPVKKQTKKLKPTGNILNDLKVLGVDPQMIKRIYENGIGATESANDLGEIAMRLRSSEFGYVFEDVNGDPAQGLAEYLSRVASGDASPLNAARMEAEREQSQIAQHKEMIQQRAKELGLKGIGGKRTLQVVEAHIAETERLLAEKEAARNRNTETALDKFDALQEDAIPFNADGETDLAAQMRAMGFSEKEIQDELRTEGERQAARGAQLGADVAERSAEESDADADSAGSSETTEATESRNRVDGDSGAASEGDEASGKSARPERVTPSREDVIAATMGGFAPLELVGQTNAEIRAQEAQRVADEEAAARAEKEPSGPTVKADQVDLFNTQGGIFDTPATGSLQNSGDNATSEFVKTPNGSIDFGEKDGWKLLWGGASVPTVASGANPLAESSPNAGVTNTMTPGQSSDSTVAQNTQNATHNTGDAGAELTYNKRNRLSRALKWDDVADKEAALRVASVIKAKVVPKPDYEAMISEGMEPMIAYMVKLAYDALAAKPVVRGAPTDEQLQLYITAMNRYMDGVMAWAKNPDSVRAFVNQIARRASVMSAMQGGAMIDLSKLAESTGKSMLDTVYPEGWKNHKDEAAIISSGRTYIPGLQPGAEDAMKAMKEIGKGWPGKMESWQKQGYSVKPSAGNVEVQSAGFKDGGYSVKINNRWDKNYPTKEEAEARAAQIKPFLFLDKYGRLVSEHDTEEQAIEAAREAVKREAKSDQVKEEGINVAAAERTGAAHRQEGEDISSDRLIETFGFKAMNFGNWMKGETPSMQKERQLHLNHIYDSFMDLAGILGVPPKAMSLNGLLGIAVGAQGSGRGAIAHFVPGVNEINITRTAGAGALAHEWGHALDHNFARLAGLDREKKAYLTEHTARRNGHRTVVENGRQVMKNDVPAFSDDLRPEILEKFKAVIQAMNRRMETQEEVDARVKSYVSMADSRADKWIKSVRQEFERNSMKPGTPLDARADALKRLDKLNDRMKALDFGDGYVKAGDVGIFPVVNEVRKLYKEVFGRIYSIDQSKGLHAALFSLKSTKEDLAAYKKHEPSQVSTDYANASASADRDSKREYWNTNLEKFARAFDAFVTDTIEANAAKNTYLSGIEAVAPAGEERKAINAAIRDLVSEFKTKETDDGVALFSRANKPDNSHTNDTLRASLANIFGGGFIAKLEQTGKFKIVTEAEANEIIGNYGDVSYSTEGAPLAFFNPEDGNTYLIAENIQENASPDFIKGLMSHELGVHALRMGRDSAGFKAILDQVQRMIDAKNPAAMAAKAQAERAGTPEADLLEEVAGYVVQNAPESSLASKVIAWFKNQIFRMTGYQVKLNDSDLAAMAASALRKSPELMNKDLRRNGDAAFAKDESQAVQLAKAFRKMVSFEKEAFEYDKLKADRDLAKTLATIDRDVKIRKMQNGEDNTRSGATEQFELTTPDGKKAYVFRFGNDVQADLSKLKSSVSKGTALYQGVASWAFANDYVFEGDSAGISLAAILRRTENMLSSVLRHGTSHHVRPHADQTRPGNSPHAKRFGVSPLQWSTGDHDANLGNLLITSYNNLKQIYPEIENVIATEYGDFVSATTGDLITTDDFKRLASEIEKRYESHRKTGEKGRISPFGDRTIARAAVVQGLLRGNLASGDSELRSNAGLVRKKLYSRNVGSQTQTSPSGNAAAPSRWQQLKQRAGHLTDPETVGKLVYELQDKLIDLKHLRDRIKNLGGLITDLNDAYLGEELYHGRVAKRTEEFLSKELKPFLADLRAKAIGISEFEQFLHARHAKERNAAMANRNPSQAEIDAGKKADPEKWKNVQAFRGTEDGRLSLSGMSDTEADAILVGMPKDKRSRMDALAAKVDAITAETLDLQLRSGLIDQQLYDAIKKSYKHYVPLHRDEAHPEGGNAHPIGQGFSTKGTGTKRATGSNQKVTNILGHIAMSREQQITRAEKNNVARKLYLMAVQNPMKDYWQVDVAKQIKTVDERTGFVRSSVDPTYKNSPNVVVARVGGNDVAVIFNQHNPEALRLAESIKNLDLGDLHRVLGWVSKGTRWFASVNTQYNPIFGMMNLARDAQSGLLNLSTTQLKDDVKKVASSIPAAMRAIYRAEREKTPANQKWADLWEEYQRIGGQTGYRDLFANAEDRAKSLLKELEALDRGKTMQAAHAVVDWLSDYNTAMENSVRLSAYKAALDKGMSKEQAASLAKNLTVNFNRKGRQAREIGALYAFFNASIQGNKRLAETLSGPMGKKIMAGGVMLGMVQTIIAMIMMGGGEDDDEYAKIPEFVKERSIVIPVGKDRFISIPLPLGFHVLPNIGRIAVEMMMGGKDKTPAKQFGSLMKIMADAFNPIGGSSDPIQMAAPTVIDPVAALLRNKDWTGRPIYRDDRSPLDPTPGHARAKDSASAIGHGLAVAINSITGGNEYRPGAWSPTPDQIDYIFGQLTGGLGRELMKLNQTVAAPITGDELPPHKIPLLGRVYGETSGPSGEGEKFYENVKKLNEVMNEAQGRSKNNDGFSAYMKSEPLTQIAGAGQGHLNAVQKLRAARREVIQNGLPGFREEAKQYDTRIGETMKNLNVMVRKEEEKAARR